MVNTCHRIAERRDAAINKRQKVKATSAERTKQLQDSLVWHQFCRDADEVISSVYCEPFKIISSGQLLDS